MYKILKNTIEMDDYSVQKLSNLQPPEPFEWNTVEGTELNVDDCIGGKGKIEVKGNTEQKQLSGKNLFNHYLYPSSTTFKGVTLTNNGDGSFTLNGTCTENNTSFRLGDNEYIKNLLNEGDVTQTAYYISGNCSKAGSSSARTIIRFNYDTGIDKMIPLEELSTQRIISKINPQTSRETSWSWGIILDAGDTFNNFTIKYQVEKGSVGTDWEQYCGGQPSPNPDYPQPIKVVTGDNVVKHVGKNLFNKSSTVGGVLTENGTISSGSQYVTSDFIKIDSQKTYTKTATNSARVKFYDANKNVISNASFSDISNFGTPLTFTIPYANAKYIRYSINKSILDTQQLEEGSTQTPYEPYIGEKYEVYLPSLNKNILDTRYTKVGSVNAETGEYVYNSNNLMGENYIKVEPNTTYCLSGNTTFSGIRLSEYDENKTHIKRSQSNSPVVVITTTNNTHYVRWSFNYNSQPVDINLAKTLELQLEQGNVRTSFIECEPLELCKIGDYEDIPFKNVVGDENYNAELESGAWYKKGVIRKYTTGVAASIVSTTGYRIRLKNMTELHDMESSTNVRAYGLSTNSIVNQSLSDIRYNGGWKGLALVYKQELRDMIGEFSTDAELLEWFNNNVTVYAVIDPTYDYIDYTKITDTTLISQLEVLRKAKWFKGVNHWWTETENLEPVLKGTYKQSNNLRLQALENILLNQSTVQSVNTLASTNISNKSVPTKQITEELEDTTTELENTTTEVTEESEVE